MRASKSGSPSCCLRWPVLTFSRKSSCARWSSRVTWAGRVRLRIGAPDERETLEHEDAVEQRRAAWEFSTPLDLDERRGIERAHLELLVVQPPQPVAQRVTPAQARAERNGVDEQTDHVLDLRQLRRSARDRYAERNVITAGVARQHDRPGRLGDGAQRGALRTREMIQCGQRRRGEPRLVLGMARRGSDHGSAAA